MKTIVFGGTGNVGQAIVDKLIAINQPVAVLTRQLETSTSMLNYITGDVLDYDAVENCIAPEDQIIIALGFNNSAPDTMSRGTRNILEVMKLKNCKRIICLSALGVGDSWDYMPDKFREMAANDPVIKASFDDHEFQENLVKAMDFEWTIVRPPEIVNTEESKIFSVLYPSENSSFQISKFDVAQFIVDELFAKKFVGQTVIITS